MTESCEGPVTHPSGWWKASDGQWYPPEQRPAAQCETSADLPIAVTIAAGTLALASVVPWTHGNGNLTLLLGGTAAAFFTRWWVFGRAQRDWAS